MNTRKLLSLTIGLDLTLYSDGHVEWETNEAPITATGQVWPGAQGSIQKHLLEMMLRKYDERTDGEGGVE